MLGITNPRWTELSFGHDQLLDLGRITTADFKKMKFGAVVTTELSVTHNTVGLARICPQATTCIIKRAPTDLSTPLLIAATTTLPKLTIAIIVETQPLALLVGRREVAVAVRVVLR